jgi:hypothetical protein
MLARNFLRSLFAICLSCLLFLNSFASPALANDVAMIQNGSMIEDVGIVNGSVRDVGIVLLNTVEEVGRGFWRGFGEAVGGAVGVVTVCYVVDVAITPLFPPAATYLPMCPAIGATVGTFSSVKAMSKASGHA